MTRSDETQLIFIKLRFGLVYGVMHRFILTLFCKTIRIRVMYRFILTLFCKTIRIRVMYRLTAVKRVMFVSIAANSIT